MRYRQLGATDLQVSVVGFGGWAMGGRWWGRVDDGESLAAVQCALDRGITLFDTAPAYGFGHSEELLGRALATRRHDVVIATKCGLQWDESGRIHHDNSAKRIHEEVDLSLRRLGVDAIDLYQIHWPDPATPIAETMGALMDVRRAGKIRHVGCSNFSEEQMQEASRHGELATLQPPLSLLQPAAEREVLPYCERHDLGVLVYGPLARGLLTGKFRRDACFPADDLRSKDARFQGAAFARNLEFVDTLRAIAERRSCSVGQLAIAWTLSQSAVTTALCGAKTPAQVEENAAAGDLVLEAQDLQEIELARSGLKT